MSDLISRQAAIDALKKNTFRLTFAEEQNCEGHVAWSAEAVYSDVMEGALLDLPSAQPEIIRCKECKYYRDGDCWHEWDNDGRIYYQSVIDAPNPDDYCSRAERKEE